MVQLSAFPVIPQRGDSGSSQHNSGVVLDAALAEIPEEGYSTGDTYRLVSILPASPACLKGDAAPQDLPARSSRATNDGS
jgi:hypothetical protein